MRLTLLISAIFLFSVGAFSQGTINVPTPVCEGDSAVQLSSTAPSGTWGGAADTLGVFDATVGAAGNPYLVTYAYLDSLSQSHTDSAYIYVGLIPNVEIDSVGPFCESAGIQQLTATPLGGSWGSVDGSTSSDGEFNPFSGAAASPYYAWYTYVDTIGCSNTDTLEIVVLPSPTVTLSAPGVVCPDDTAFHILPSPLGGTWITGVDSTGLFDPAANPPGSYQVVYSYTDTAGCTNVASVTVVVNGYTVPSSFSFSSLCLGAGPDTLQAIGLSGGIFYSGATDANGVVHPDSLGAGTHIVHFITSCVGCCPYSDSLSIEVFAPSPLSLLDSSVCANADSVLLATNGTVDTWGGVATSAGYVYPLALGLGAHTVLASGSDMNGCAASDSLLINVLPNIPITFSSNSPYCSGGLPDTLQILPGGGMWNGPIDSANVFSLLDTAGTYAISYTVSDSGYCTSTYMDTLIVLASPTVSIDPVTGFCSTDAPALLAAQPSGGLWTGGATSSGIFDPGQALISGTIPVQYTYTDSVGCMGVDSIDVVVLLEPEVIFGVNGPYCKGIGLVPLDAAPSLGTWGGDANPDGTFDGNNEPGNYVVSYTVTNGFCTVTAFDTIVVEDCTSIEEFSSADLRVFPDPADQELTIDLGEWHTISSLKVYDETGRIALSLAPGFTNRMQLSTAQLSNGAYYLMINGKRAARFSVVH